MPNTDKRFQSAPSDTLLPAAFRLLSLSLYIYMYIYIYVKHKQGGPVSTPAIRYGRQPNDCYYLFIYIYIYTHTKTARRRQ